MKKVLVIGDSCQDMFRYGTCGRLSPEAPVPVMKPTKTTGNGGMAINVMENLKALGIEVDIITNDIRPVKTRYVDEVSNQMLLRVDEKDEIKQITPKEIDKIFFDDYDAIVISDYNKGFLNEVDISHIANSHPLVFMDSKKKFGNWARSIDFIKINEKEFEVNHNWLLDKFHPNKFIVTMGSHGAVYEADPYTIEDQHEVRDLSGAGDTFLAALVADYVENNDIRSSIRFANKCAAWVVSQKGVAIINTEKI